MYNTHLDVDVACRMANLKSLFAIQRTKQNKAKSHHPGGNTSKDFLASKQILRRFLFLNTEKLQLSITGLTGTLFSPAYFQQ